VHRDLKLPNVFIHFPSQSRRKLVSKEFLQNYEGADPIEVVIGDFGLSKILDEGEALTNTHNVGSPFI